jgi:integrase
MRSNLKAACAHLGYANLAKITPTTLNDTYIAMLKGDTLSGRPSSGTHVRHIHTDLSHALAQAVREGVLSTNPCDSATPPRTDTKERHAIDPAKVREFLGELGAGNDNDCAYLLAVCMGLRRGEVCGLSWGDVDFENMSLSRSPLSGHSADAQADQDQGGQPHPADTGLGRRHPAKAQGAPAEALRQAQQE